MYYNSSFILKLFMYNCDLLKTYCSFMRPIKCKILDNRYKLMLHINTVVTVKIVVRI